MLSRTFTCRFPPHHFKEACGTPCGACGARRVSTMSLANSGATFAGNLRGAKASAPKVAASKASGKASLSVFQDKDKVFLLVFAQIRSSAGISGGMAAHVACGGRTAGDSARCAAWLCVQTGKQPSGDLATREAENRRRDPAEQIDSTERGQAR